MHQQHAFDDRWSRRNDPHLRPLGKRFALDPRCRLEFDSLGYIVYDSKTKTWWTPGVLATGDYSTESTQQTGKKTVWNGTFYNAAMGKTVPIRDTFIQDSMTTYKDLSQAQIGGTWKTEGIITCTKS